MSPALERLDLLHARMNNNYPALFGKSRIGYNVEATVVLLGDYFDGSVSGHLDSSGLMSDEEEQRWEYLNFYFEVIM